jgi:hypothetical protein
MKWVASFALAVLAACGGSSTTGTASSPVVTGDTCALHQDASSCRAAAQGCVWYANTRPCQVGQTCPAGWCSTFQPAGGGGDGSASAACACAGSGADVCVEQIGGPAIQAQAQTPITCEAISTNCTLSDHCACLTSSTNGTCRSSEQVTKLCVCDNGIR